MPRPKQKRILDKDWILCPDIDFADYGFRGVDGLHARFWLNSIYYRQIVSHPEPDDWIYLPQRSLEIVMGGGGSHIRRVRLKLEDAGLIVCDNWAIRDVKPFGYRLGPALEGLRWQKWAISDRTYVKRFTKFREYICRPRNLSPVGERLRERAMGLVKSADWDDVVREVELIKGGVRQVVDFLDNGLCEWSECPMGRFHSLWTRMPVELRQSFCDVEGDPLVEVDIVNSQMFFLLNLLADVQQRPGFYKERALDGDIQRQIAEARRVGGWVKYMKHYKPIEGARGEEHQDETSPAQPGSREGEYSIVHVPGLGHDYQEFADDVLSGRIYERWAELRGFGDDRSAAKINLFQILYGPSPKRMQAFNEVYPSTGRLIEYLKQVHGYWWIGRTLQRMESQRVIQTACRRIVEERPDLALLTCHDSMAVPEHSLSYVEDVIADSHGDLRYGPKLRCKALEGSLG